MAIARSVTQAPSFIDDLAKDYGTQLAGLTAVPLDTSRFAPQVAAQDPLQQQAATLAGQGVGAYQPFLQQAQTTLAGAQGMLGSGAGTGAGTISDFMSPFQSQVIDTTLGEFDRNRAIQEQTLRDQQAKLGVLGSGRAGVQLAEYGSGADRERALLQAGLLQQGFNQAQAARQQDFANRQALANQRLGLAGFQTGLASQVPGLQRADISTLGSVGAIQQAQAQAQADAARETARLETFEPFERLGTFGSGIAQLISGYPGRTQFTSVPNPTPLQTALGVGSTLAGIYGNIVGPVRIR